MEPAEEQMSYKGSGKQRIWHHNSFHGHVAMAQANMQSIINSPTTTLEAKGHAKAVLVNLHDLKLALATRVDP